MGMWMLKDVDVYVGVSGKLKDNGCVCGCGC